MYAKSFTVCLALVAAVVLSSPTSAVPNSGGRLGDHPPGVSTLFTHLQVGPGPQPAAQEKSARSDTTWFGRYRVVGDDYYAIPYAQKNDAVWTFDRGIGPMGDPDRIDGGEGWAAINLTTVEQVLFRIIDSGLDLGPGVQPPVLEGARSLWVGASAPEANEYGYDCLAGYGNVWNQLAISEPLAYSGSGTVQLSFLYFQDSEPSFDGTQVYLQREDGSRLLLNPSATLNLGFTGRIGIDNQGNITPASFSRTITQAEIGVAQQIRFVFEFRSDRGWSDQDCGYPTRKGPFAVDRVGVLGGGIDRLWGYEQGAEGWTYEIFAPVPDHAGIADFDCYGASLECLSDNVIEAHAGNCDQGYHPPGQILRLESPICDLGTAWEEAFLESDSYWEIAEGMFIWRYGWRYYPAPGPLGDRWSDRVGSNVWFLVGGTDCVKGARSSASSYVPSSAQKVIAVIEIAALDPFGGPPIPTNFPGPLLDNLVVGAIGVPDPAGIDPVADHASRGLVASPNPSSAGMSLAYRLAQASHVRLEVVDVAGRVIRTLEEGQRPAGNRSIRWDGTDGRGHAVGAGIYWVCLRLDGMEESRKVVVMR